MLIPGNSMATQQQNTKQRNPWGSFCKLVYLFWLISTSEHVEIHLEGLKWVFGLKRSSISKQLSWTWQVIFAVCLFLEIFLDH